MFIPSALHFLGQEFLKLLKNPGNGVSVVLGRGERGPIGRSPSRTMASLPVSPDGDKQLGGGGGAWAVLKEQLRCCPERGPQSQACWFLPRLFGFSAQSDPLQPHGL